MKIVQVQAILIALVSALLLTLAFVFKDSLPENGIISGQALRAALVASTIYSVLAFFGKVELFGKKKS